MATPPRQRKFADRVIDRVKKASPAGTTVQANMQVELRSGRTRPVTAAIVRATDEPPLLVQAVGGNSRDAREDALDKAFHLFSLANVDESPHLAVFIGVEQSWDQAMARELKEVAEVTFFDERGQVESAITRHLTRPHPAAEPDPLAEFEASTA